MKAYSRNRRRSRGRRASAALIVAVALASVGVTATSVVVTAEPASAHARCDGVTHYDWHTIAFHYDRHAFSTYEYSNHNHWWSGTNHVHTHVRFVNTTHNYGYFQANC